MAVALSLIAILTLRSQQSDAILPYWCLRCGDLWPIDGLLNAALFAPLGIGLGILGQRVITSAALAAGVSIAIELLQRYLVSGRLASIGDIVGNTGGALAGALIAAHALPLARPASGAARRLAAAWALGWLALTAAASSAMRLSIHPRDLWGQWAPDLAHLDQFRGNILNGTLGPDPFPWLRAADSYRLHAILVADRVEVTATIIPDAPTGRVAPILSIFDAASDEALLLGQKGTSAVFRMRTRAADYGLRSPEAVLDDAFPALAGVARPLTLLATRRGSVLRLATGAPSGSAPEVTTELGPATAWMTLLPSSAAIPPLRLALTTLWLPVLLAPAAYWMSASDLRRRWLLAAATTVLVAGLSAIPLVLRVAPAGIATWLGAISSAGGAYAVGAALRRRWRRGDDDHSGHAIVANRGENLGAAGRSGGHQP